MEEPEWFKEFADRLQDEMKSHNRGLRALAEQIGQFGAALTHVVGTIQEMDPKAGQFLENSLRDTLDKCPDFNIFRVLLDTLEDDGLPAGENRGNYLRLVPKTPDGRDHDGSR